MTEQAQAPFFRPLVRGVREDLRRSFVVLMTYEVVFKVLAALILLPVMGALLFHLVRLVGRTAITNEDLIGFVLSPVGVLYGFLFGLKILGLGLLEHAGVMALAGLRQTGHWHGLRHAITVLAARSVLVLRLAGLVLVIAAAALAPFAALAALTYALLLTGQDINYYLAVKPPRFLAACAIGGFLLLGAVGTAAVLFVRWVLALPVVLFEGVAPLAALKTSARRGQGMRWRIAMVILGWLLVGFVLQAGMVAGFKGLAGWIVLSGDRHPATAVPLVIALLVAKGLVLSLVSIVLVVIHCLLILRLYVESGVRQGALERAHWGDALETSGEAPAVVRYQLGWGVAAFIGLVGMVALALTWPFALTDRVEGTAHRGYSRAAPENTLAAIRKAIEAGAEWAEIDVQLTRDGEIILLHDADLRRMTGDPRRPGELLYSDIRTLAAVGHFGQAFAGEHIPTLREAIEEARGKIRLNIELKFHGKDRTLARKVAELLRETDFEKDCFVSSLTYDGVIAARRHNPRLRTAAIITVSVGDVSKLDVDILSVSARQATDTLLRQARHLGKEVHVWTVNDRRAMRRMIERGVNNVITDDPEAFVEVRREQTEQGATQRLLMVCWYLLG